MRKLHQVFLGLFVGGVLLTGIGTGIAFVEYSTLNYGGHKLIGEEDLVIDTFTYQWEEENMDLVLLDDFDYHASRVTELVEDTQIPKNEIQYEVTYNENRVRPYIWASKAEESTMSQEEPVHIGLEMDYLRNELADFMESKDLILSELKKHTISSYEIPYVTKVLVKVNPETMQKIHRWRE